MKMILRPGSRYFWTFLGSAENALRQADGRKYRNDPCVPSSPHFAPLRDTI